MVVNCPEGVVVNLWVGVGVGGGAKLNAVGACTGMGTKRLQRTEPGESWCKHQQ